MGGGGGGGVAGQMIKMRGLPFRTTVQEVRVRGMPHGAVTRLSPGNKTQELIFLSHNNPLRASPQIASFFEGYDALPETINFGMDRMRRPSGEAWIAFRAAEEAERAATNLNKHYIGNRYIELQVV